MGAEGWHPDFCRKLYSPLLTKNPTETANISTKAPAKTEGNGSYPLLREHQSNFWNWRYNHDRVLWLSLLIAWLSAALCCQSGTDNLHSAVYIQVMLCFERRHRAEWPSLSQLWIQVSSQKRLMSCVWGWPCGVPLSRRWWKERGDFHTRPSRGHELAPGIRARSMRRRKAQLIV